MSVKSQFSNELACIICCNNNGCSAPTLINCPVVSGLQYELVTAGTPVAHPIKPPIDFVPFPITATFPTAYAFSILNNFPEYLNAQPINPPAPTFPLVEFTFISPVEYTLLISEL